MPLSFDKLHKDLKSIFTDRLILIPFTKEIITSIKEDEGCLLKNNNLIYGIGWPDEDAWETFPKIEQNLNLVSEPTGFESWLIVKKESLAIIGDVGFKGQPGSDCKVDIGYAIISPERQQGFAVEAVQALINWVFNQPGVAVVTASCFRTNLGSKKVLQKIGFVEDRNDIKMLYWSIEKHIL